MATESTGEREMVLGITGGYRYIGFRPPLEETQVQQLPAPEGDIGRGGRFMPFVSIERDGSMTLCIDAVYFYEPAHAPVVTPESSRFIAYARGLAEHLGGISLDTTVREIGVGSVFPEIVQGT